MRRPERYLVLVMRVVQTFLVSFTSQICSKYILPLFDSVTLFAEPIFVCYLYNCIQRWMMSGVMRYIRDGIEGTVILQRMQT